MKEKRRDILESDLSIELCSPKQDMNELMDSLIDKYWYPDANKPISTLGGCPKHFPSIFSYSSDNQTFERHALYRMMINSNGFESCLEILTKSLIYREMQEGTMVPFILDNTNKQIEWYKIKKNIITGKGFTASLLVPFNKESNAKPILTISGSNFHPSGLDMISSCIEDMRWCLGQGAFFSAKSELEDLMKTIKDDSLILSGHSLGGNLAQWLLPQYFEKVSRVVTFNAPGVNKAIHKEFEEKLTANDGRCPKIDIIQTEWDIVHQVEYPHLGYNNDNTSLIRFKLENALRTFTHTYLCLSNPANIKIIANAYGDTSIKESDMSKGCDYHNQDASKKIAHLNNFLRDFLEVLRKLIGLLINLLIIPCREISRVVCPSRAQAKDVHDSTTTELSMV